MKIYTQVSLIIIRLMGSARYFLSSNKSLCLYPQYIVEKELVGSLDPVNIFQENLENQQTKEKAMGKVILILKQLWSGRKWNLV